MHSASHETAMPRRRRRWFSYSLRTLLLLTTLLAIALGVWVNRAERQRRAVAAIREAGGDVVYDVKPHGFAHDSSWLRRWLGQDYFADVVGVRLRSSSDAGLARLRGLTKLKGLDLIGIQISDAGLVHLRGLTNLKQLWLAITPVGDSGLVHLRGLTNLESLELYNTQVSDAGLVHLRGLTKLETLLLNGTKVSDVGLVHLRGLTKLAELELSRTPVTDSGLVHLHGLKKLNAIFLDNTRVSDAGCHRLQQALPNCRISR